MAERKTRRAGKQQLIVPTISVDDYRFDVERLMLKKSLKGQRCGARFRSARMQDLRAYAQAYLLIWAVTLLLMMEDDAAMLACMFC